MDHKDYMKLDAMSCFVAKDVLKIKFIDAILHEYYITEITTRRDQEEADKQVKE